MVDETESGLGDGGSSAVEENTISVNLFDELDLFDGLNSSEVREIVHATERRNLEAGEVLFRQDDQAEALFLIEHGELEVRAQSDLGEEVVLAMLGAGDVVGEMAILEGSNPRSATVEALSDVQVFELSRSKFNAMRAERRPVAYKLILNLAYILGERRRQTDRRVAEVYDDPETHIDAFESQVHDMIGRFRKA